MTRETITITKADTIVCYFFSILSNFFILKNTYIARSRQIYQGSREEIVFNIMEIVKNDLYIEPYDKRDHHYNKGKKLSISQWKLSCNFSLPI